MKTKPPVSTKKPTVALKDLKSKKNPKGGGTVSGTVTVNEHGTLGVATLTPGKR